MPITNFTREYLQYFSKSLKNNDPAPFLVPCTSKGISSSFTKINLHKQAVHSNFFDLSQIH